MIEQLSLQDFRGHTRKLTFRPGYNTVVGKNEIGKSSIKEAIAFLWFGTDSEGTKNPDHLITVSKEMTTVALKTPKAVITRRKKVGATSEIKLEREGFPPLKLTQTDLSGQLQLSLETFMSCWQVGFFMKLPPKDRLKVLGEVARIDRKVLLESILPQGTELPAQLKYANSKVDADLVAGLRRTDQNKKASDEGALKQLQAQKESLSGGSVIDIESYQGVANELQAKVEAFDTYQRLLTVYEKELGKYNSYLGDVGRVAERMLAAEKAKSDLELQLNTLLHKESEGVKATEALAKTFENAKANLKVFNDPVPVAPKPQVAGVECDHCYQVVSEEHAKAVVERYNKALMEYNQAQRAVMDHNAPLEATMKDVTKKADAARKALLTIQETIISVNTKLQMAIKDISEGEVQASALKAVPVAKPKAPTKPEGDEAALKKELAETQSALLTAKTFKQQLEGIASQEALYQKAIQTHAWNIERYALIEDAIKKLPLLETQKTLEKLQVAGVTLTLLDGGLVVKDTHGVDYRSLSDGRRMKIDTQICLSLQNAAGPTAPRLLFIDNADLMDSHIDFVIPDGVQVIKAHVDSSVSDVEVRYN